MPGESKRYGPAFVSLVIFCVSWSSRYISLHLTARLAKTWLQSSRLQECSGENTDYDHTYCLHCFIEASSDNSPVSDEVHSSAAWLLQRSVIRTIASSTFSSFGCLYSTFNWQLTRHWYTNLLPPWQSRWLVQAMNRSRHHDTCELFEHTAYAPTKFWSDVKSQAILELAWHTSVLTVALWS